MVSVLDGDFKEKLMKFNTVLDIIAIFIITFSLFFMSGCSMFKPGTAERIETIAIEDELKMVEDELKELEGDLINDGQKPVRKKHASN